MPIIVNQQFKNLPTGLTIPEGDLNVLTGPNNGGKTAILRFLFHLSSISASSDYVSPSRFHLTEDLSGLNYAGFDPTRMRKERKGNTQGAEAPAPDPTRELVGLPDTVRDQIVEWHNRFFGELVINRTDPANEYSPPQITIDGRSPSQAGSGSRAVLAILCSLLNPATQVALIDEPEISIEPQTQRRLATLIKKVSLGEDGLAKKQVYVATHSHIFLDRAAIQNNYSVIRDPEGYASIHQIQTPGELQDLVFRLLGNSPGDLLFPENILVVEGPSDHIYWRRLLELSGEGAVVAHYAESDSRVSEALSAIDQMLKTQAYVPWYRDRLCVAVDSSVSDQRLAEWRAFLRDDGTRVRRLAKNGIEYYYPKSALATLCQVAENDLDEAISQFLHHFRQGAREAKLGALTCSKKSLADAVAQRLETRHLSGLDREIALVLDALKRGKFSAFPT